MAGPLAVAAVLAVLVAACGRPAGTASVDPGWARVPVRSAALAAKGLIGGEGCQVVRALGASRADPALMLLGADVGGVYRSLTGGDEWHPAMVGWHSRGATAFAFDPANASHVLGVGGNSNPAEGSNGVHVSFDGAASWTFVLPIPDATGCLDGSAIAFDPTSAQPTAALQPHGNTPHRGGSATTAYFSSAAGLWRSVNGGRNWTLANAYLANACLVVDGGGRLFAASSDAVSYGLYACGAHYDGAAGNCTRLRHEYTTGLDLAGDNETLFISNWAGVMVSRDHGASFALLPGRGLPKPGATAIRHVAVSPADARRLAVFWAFGPSWNATHAVSADGGATWTTAAFDDSLAFMPDNGRSGKPLWHATDPSVLWSAGGDWPTRSVDGGLTRAWRSNGYAVVMTGGGFAFSRYAPNVLFLAFQDYAGAHSADGGTTWTWAGGPGGLSGHTWGGMGYGGFALNASVMWAGDAESWGGPRTLKMTSDGGRTWRVVRDPGNATAAAVFAGLDVSGGDPLDARVGFASNFRTADGGASWARMTGCAGVLTTTPAAQGALLFGVSPEADAVVVSTDHGASWATVLPCPATGDGAAVWDVAYDWRAKALYVVAGNRGSQGADGDALYRCTASNHSLRGVGGARGSPWGCAALTALLPADQLGGARVTSVAVDPVDPSVVYVGAERDIILADNAVLRSTDSGKSFHRIVLDTPLAAGPSGPLQGPHEVSWVRVHPVTRWLWAAGGCFGVWKAPPPLPAAGGRHLPSGAVMIL